MPLPRRPGRLSLRAPRLRSDGAQLPKHWRLGMGALGLFVTGYGVLKSFAEPAGTYGNYWGGQVFGPFVILIGVILVLGALFPRRTAYLKPASRPNKEVEFPHESIDRPWGG